MTPTPVPVITPAAPGPFSLVSPASSPNVSSTPTILVAGVQATDSVTLFTDAGCSVAVGTGISSGPTVNLTTNSLSVGAHSIYGRTMNAGGISSACSVTNIAYTVSAPPGFADPFTGAGLSSNWLQASTAGAGNTYLSLDGSSSSTLPVSVTGGKLVFNAPAGTSGNYNGIETLHTFDYTDASASIELTDPPSGSDQEVGLWIEVGGGNGWEIYVFGGVLQIAREDSHSFDVTYTPFDPVAHRFWRIRHSLSADSIYFETSPDRITWTVRRTVSCDYDQTSVKISIYTGGASSTSSAKFDNFSTDALQLP